MIKKIMTWLFVIVCVKLLMVLIVRQFDLDPRRNIDAREDLMRKSDANTVFIGTSRTLYGVDNRLFDSLHHFKIRSYNLGLFSISPACSFQLAKNIIKRDNGVRNILIELSALDYRTVLLTPANILPEVLFRARVLNDCRNISMSSKSNGFLSALNTTLFQMLSISPEIVRIKKQLNSVSDPVEGKPDLDPQGHQSVSMALSEANKTLQANRAATLSLIESKRGYSSNVFFISQINELIALAESHNKKVIFYLPNNTTQTEFLILSDVLPYIAAENLIPLPVDVLDGALFRPENLFDPHHLNKKGSRIYSQLLYRESVKLLR